jgi:hypothetical protein
MLSYNMWLKFEVFYDGSRGAWEGQPPGHLVAAISRWFAPLYGTTMSCKFYRPEQMQEQQPPSGRLRHEMPCWASVPTAMTERWTNCQFLYGLTQLKAQLSKATAL